LEKQFSCLPTNTNNNNNNIVADPNKPRNEKQHHWTPTHDSLSDCDTTLFPLCYATHIFATDIKIAIRDNEMNENDDQEEASTR